MAEDVEGPPRPGYPGTACFIADLTVKTPNGRRRNRLYYQPIAPPTSIQHVPLVANALFAFWAGVYKAVMSADAQFERVDLRWKDGVTLWRDVSTTPPQDGDLALPLSESEQTGGDLLPDEVTLICRKVTGFGGHSKQGRIFVSGLAEIVQSQGRVMEDYSGACKALANKIPTDVQVDISDNAENGYGAYATYLHARHWDRKNDVLVPILRAHALDIVGSRRDRRRPLVFEPIA